MGTSAVCYGNTHPARHMLTGVLHGSYMLKECDRKEMNVQLF